MHESASTCLPKCSRSRAAKRSALQRASVADICGQPAYPQEEQQTCHPQPPQDYQCAQHSSIRVSEQATKAEGLQSRRAISALQHFACSSGWVQDAYKSKQNSLKMHLNNGWQRGQHVCYH